MNNQPIYTRAVTAAADYSVTTAIHNGSTDSLYVNGALAFIQGGKLPAIAGLSGTGVIGSSLLGASFHGPIGELLDYDPALSDTEREVVEHYLRQKFGTN